MEINIEDTKKILEFSKLLRKTQSQDILKLLSMTHQGKPIRFTQEVIGTLCYLNQSSVSYYLERFGNLGIPINSEVQHVTQVIMSDDPMALILGDSFSERSGQYKLFYLETEFSMQFTIYEDLQTIDLGKFSAANDQLIDALSFFTSEIRFQILNFLYQHLVEDEVPSAVRYDRDFALDLVGMKQSAYRGSTRPIPLSKFRKFPLVQVSYPNRKGHIKLIRGGLQFHFSYSPISVDEIDVHYIEDVPYAVINQDQV